MPLGAITTPDQILDGREITVDVGGLAADAELRFGLSDIAEVAGFAFLLSGDAPPAIDGGRYRSFIGLAPFWIAPHSVQPYMPTRPPSSQARAVLLRRGLP